MFICIATQIFVKHSLLPRINNFYKQCSHKSWDHGVLGMAVLTPLAWRKYSQLHRLWWWVQPVIWGKSIFSMNLEVQSPHMGVWWNTVQNANSVSIECSKYNKNTDADANFLISIWCCSHWFNSAHLTWSWTYRRFLDAFITCQLNTISLLTAGI